MLRRWVFWIVLCSVREASADSLDVSCGAQQCIATFEGASPTELRIHLSKQPGHPPRFIARDSGMPVAATSCDLDGRTFCIENPPAGELIEDTTKLVVRVTRATTRSTIPRDVVAEPRLETTAKLLDRLEHFVSPEQMVGTDVHAVPGQFALPPDVALALRNRLNHIDEVAVFRGREVPSKAPIVGSSAIVPASSSQSMTPDDVAFADVVAVGNGRAYWCSGVVVARRVIVTARHCVPATSIAIGSNLALHRREYQIERVVGHPDPSVDASVIIMPTRLPIAPRPRRRAADIEPPGGMIRLVGFGINDLRVHGGFGIKRLVDARSDGWGCDGNRPARVGCRPATDLLLVPDSGRDTCGGDSGGPAFEDAGETWRLVAITSHAIDARTRECGGGGIYIRADFLDPWLTKQIEEHP